MHTDSLDRWQHTHVFLGERHDRNERQTWLVIALTCVMMVGEIAGGALFGSMALLADGLHMSTHAGALLIAALAYRFARRHARSARFAFGTGKVGDLAAFTSAIVLAMIAVLIAIESVGRLLAPVPIAFAEALPIAVLGLAVNLLSAWLLHDDHGHGAAHEEEHAHEHEHGHEHHHGHAHGHDHNLRAAYVHVLADAATSMLAILGLLLGWAYGWNFMDPLMGIVGALVIANWSYGLLRRAGAVLLDMTPDERLAATIRETLETGEDRVADLHLWRLGPGHFGAIVSVVSHEPEPPAAYKRRLASIAALSHLTVEVEHCA
jgi:cation diffusion facilitator family transporter